MGPCHLSSFVRTFMLRMPGAHVPSEHERESVQGRRNCCHVECVCRCGPCAVGLWRWAQVQLCFRSYIGAFGFCVVVRKTPLWPLPLRDAQFDSKNTERRYTHRGGMHALRSSGLWGCGVSSGEASVGHPTFPATRLRPLNNNPCDLAVQTQGHEPTHKGNWEDPWN